MIVATVATVATIFIYTYIYILYLFSIQKNTSRVVHIDLVATLATLAT